MRRKHNLPGGWGLPLALLTIATAGEAVVAHDILTYFLIIQALSLCVSDALRRGASRLISPGKVLGGTLIAMLMSLASGAAVVFFTGLSFTSLTDGHMLPIAATALCMLRCVTALFDSQSDGVSTQLTELLTFAGVTAPVFMMSTQAAQYKALAMSVSCVLLLALIICVGFGRRDRVRLSIGFLKDIPVALLRTLSYPALYFAACHFMEKAAILPEDLPRICGFAAGLLLFEAMRSTFHRAKEDSSGVNTAVTLAALFIAVWSLPLLFTLSFLMDSAFAAPLILSAACGLIWFCAPFYRTIPAALLLAAGAAGLWFMPLADYKTMTALPHVHMIACAGTLLAALLMIPDWAFLARRSKANRIRRRAAKMRRRT